jgi:hypothetical protein
LGWRQYLYWFAQQEAAVAAPHGDPEASLLHADARWQTIDAAKAFPFDRSNNGECIRACLNSLLL